MDVNEILRRVGEIIGSQSNVDIAKALQVAPQTSSNWKARRTIPWKEAYVFSIERGLSMTWLLTGEGQPWSDDVAAPPTRDKKREDGRIVTVQRLLDLLEAGPEDEVAATAAIGLIRRIRALEHRVSELEERSSGAAEKRQEEDEGMKAI